MQIAPERRHRRALRLSWVPLLLALVAVATAVVQSSRAQHPHATPEPGAQWHLQLVRATSAGDGAVAPGHLVVMASARGIAPLRAAPVGPVERRSTAYVLFRLDGGRYDHASHVDADPLDAWFLREGFEQQLAGMESGHARTVGGVAPVSPGDVSTAPAWRLDYHDVPAGRHTVEAWLVRSDHTVLAHLDPVTVRAG